ncbi:hypothetical protein HPB51_007624 [Rhipicephalus microplus]|uniref:RNase H type-1 domain-containing protein n=1 Tax=Rhipicephalus microplus TaxID=6941 RepID=A0A9J6ER02_RHIMP|nr:hypothetical protein HPB51_007624 [Rhipicephalus microplus]
MDIKRICKKACDLHHRIVLQWIPPHLGIQGNVRADDAAKAGHNTSTEIVEIPFSRQDAECRYTPGASSDPSGQTLARSMGLCTRLIHRVSSGCREISTGKKKHVYTASD